MLNQVNPYEPGNEESITPEDAFEHTFTQVYETLIVDWGDTDFCRFKLGLVELGHVLKNSAAYFRGSQESQVLIQLSEDEIESIPETFNDVHTDITQQTYNLEKLLESYNYTLLLGVYNLLNPNSSVTDELYLLRTNNKADLTWYLAERLIADFILLCDFDSFNQEYVRFQERQEELTSIQLIYVNLLELLSPHTPNENLKTSILMMGLTFYDLARVLEKANDNESSETPLGITYEVNYLTSLINDAMFPIKMAFRQYFETSLSPMQISEEIKKFSDCAIGEVLQDAYTHTLKLNNLEGPVSELEELAILATLYVSLMFSTITNDQLDKFSETHLKLNSSPVETEPQNPGNNFSKN